MINLMYIVLIAMLALNISTGSTQWLLCWWRELERTTREVIQGKWSYVLANSKPNDAQEPTEKVKRVVCDMASTVKRWSDSIYNYAQSLKVAIVREADGERVTLWISERNNIEAAAILYLNPASRQGHKLYEAINNYQARILQFAMGPRLEETYRK